MKRTARITGYQFVCFLKYLGIRAKIQDYERALCFFPAAVLGGEKELHQGWDSHHQIQKTDWKCTPCSSPLMVCWGNQTSYMGLIFMDSRYTEKLISINGLRRLKFKDILSVIGI